MVLDPASLASQTCRHDDDCVRPALIGCTYRSSVDLQSAVANSQLLALRYGTTCRLTSQLRHHSRSSDSASRHFCFRGHSLTLSFNSQTIWAWTRHFQASGGYNIPRDACFPLCWMVMVMTPQENVCVPSEIRACFKPNSKVLSDIWTRQPVEMPVLALENWMHYNAATFI